jgi:asparagine synthase (glutamine-hydrolysing)
MCGIAGIISTLKTVSQSAVQQMTDSIIHRGPDGGGVWMNDTNTVGLGHRRLSIIDLSNAGHQPMHYLDRYTITFNGEIYNYLEIKQDLVAAGYQFKSLSDTEVILAAYDKYGEACLSRFDGMFAFAIWDKKEQLLFMARDRFGEKPLFHAMHEGQFIFASEIKALWAAGLPKKINERMLFNFYYFKSLFNPDDLSETFYANITQLKPAHSMLVSASGKVMQLKCYWQIPENYEPITISDEDAKDKFASLFKESVKRRLRSDVPVGSSLSGGLDSSVVVANINQIKEKSVIQKTFSARFPGFKKDESAYIDLLLKNVMAEGFSCTPNDESVANNIDKIIAHQDEPFNSLSITAQYEVMQLARNNGVIVLLDGQGADEYLCGYPGLIDSYLMDLKKHNPKQYKKELADFQSAQAENTINSIDRRVRRMRVKQFMGSKLIDQLLLIQQKISNSADSKFINSLVSPGERIFYNRKYMHENLHGMLHYATFKGGLQELLRYADRNSMAHSLEVRLPFLSHELVEFVFSLPDSFKFRQGFTKYILRKGMEDILPPEICWRKDKIGYEVPATQVQGQPLKDYLINSVLA